MQKMPWTPSATPKAWQNKRIDPFPLGKGVVFSVPGLQTGEGEAKGGKMVCHTAQILIHKFGRAKDPVQPLHTEAVPLGERSV